MPKELKAYTVFISSPNDLQLDRQIVQDAVRTASQTYAPRGIEVKSWAWEVNTVPEIGGTPQEIINNQLGDYDIYIGLMGVRFGTPTGRWGSGTEEEFREALTLYERGQLLHIAFLFKDVPLYSASLSSETLAQLQEVARFKAEVSSQGIHVSYSKDVDLSNIVIRTIAEALNNDQKKVTSFSSPRSFSANNSEVPTISGSYYEETLDRLHEDLMIRRTTKLRLSDIWVRPELNLLSSKNAPVTSTTPGYNFDHLLTQLKTGECIHLSGGEKSGKSSICRKLMTELYQHGMFPVTLSNSRINSPDPYTIVRRARAGYIEQYDNIAHDFIASVKKEKLVVLIDDFEQIKLGPRFITEIMKALIENFGSILITTGPLFSLATFADSEEAELLSSFSKIEVTDISYHRRYELIERWCRAGMDANCTEIDLRNNVEKKRKIISDVLKTNLVPRTAVMVLILLQAIEAGQFGDLARSGYVRYYKFLIDSSILQNLPQEDIELTYALLPELAWRAYGSGPDRALYTDIAESAIDEICLRRALKKDRVYSVLGKLRNSGMFNKRIDAYEFSLRYTFYYFLSDYMNNELSQEELTSQVAILGENLYKEESSDILVFLAFHTKSKIIVAEMERQLRSTFVDEPQFEFTRDRTSPINRLIDEIPKVIVDRAKNSIRRSEILSAEQRHDEAESANRKRLTQNEFNDLFKVVTAIDVLGHVLRNHYAILDAEPKREILKLVVESALRAMGSVFDRLSNSIDGLLAVISKQEERILNIKDKERVTKLVKQLIYIIATGFIFYTMRRVARAVGDENLEISYDQTIERNESRVRLLMDLVIRLSCFTEFPKRELIQVMQTLSDQPTGLSIVRYAVAERLDFRPPSVRDMQAICRLAGLSYKQTVISRGIRGRG